RNFHRGFVAFFTVIRTVPPRLYRRLIKPSLRWTSTFVAAMSGTVNIFSTLLRQPEPQQPGGTLWPEGLQAAGARHFRDLNRRAGETIYRGN
ncbi:hypothetical protein LAD64_27280, partial [Klebsiella pneumoniae]|nr:hypothetical protein [Klebsiella pneumoniae]